jgi:hypothetical protein
VPESPKEDVKTPVKSQDTPTAPEVATQPKKSSPPATPSKVEAAKPVERKPEPEIDSSIEGQMKIIAFGTLILLLLDVRLLASLILITHL